MDRPVDDTCFIHRRAIIEPNQAGGPRPRPGYSSNTNAKIHHNVTTHTPNASVASSRFDSGHRDSSQESPRGNSNSSLQNLYQNQNFSACFRVLFRSSAHCRPDQPSSRLLRSLHASMNISWQVMLRTCGEIACQISVAVQLALPEWEPRILDTWKNGNVCRLLRFKESVDFYYLELKVHRRFSIFIILL